MKTKVLALLLTLLSVAAFGQYKTALTESSESAISLTVDVQGFATTQVSTPRGDAFIISIPKTVSTSAAGEPELPMISIPVIIGDNALMSVKVIGSEYTDYENMEVAPSKGDFPRSINPEDVPYTYGPAYQQDAFFPSVIAKLDEPYIHRDVRGQNIMLNPISYNPVTKVLRVYHHIELSMVNTGVDTRNVFTNRTKSFKLDSDFKALYENRYINFTQSMGRYNPIAENGELLIICHDAFMSAMEPFVAWKKQIGRPTTMVGTSVTGTTATAIKTYLQTYYNEHPNLTDILLVGDVAQIPGVYISAGSGWNNYSGYGDLQYGQLAGNDYYNEVLVGRFCCETEAQVTNHVNKVLNYERDLDETAAWLSVGQGVSKNEGAGSGHYGESDYQHIDYIRDSLLNYNYTTVHRDYQSVSGVSSSAAIISQHINAGVSIINYCNHGDITLWGVFSYSNSHVNALTNDYKLPYIISVACLNGKYDYNGSCFAEAWMRATNNSTGNPTGAIGGMFSYIEQPWTPPQYGQDEMVGILVESFANNIRRTMGGVSINGNMRVLDLGANSNPNKGTYNNWILFGDPTLTLRNAVPAVMNVTAPNAINTISTSLDLTATNAENALATLTFNGEILGSATITNGSATIGFEAPNATGTATLTVFGYNKKTYTTSIEITDGGTPDPLVVSVYATQPAIVIGESTQLNATATGGNGNYTYSWTPEDSLDDPSSASPTATPTSTTEYTCVVTSAGMTETKTVTVEVVKAPTNLTVTLIDLPVLRLIWSRANPATSYILYHNGEIVEQGIVNTFYLFLDIQPGTHVFEVATYYEGLISPKSDPVTVTICPTPENFAGECFEEDEEFGARLSWDRPEYEATLDRFEIYRSPADGKEFELVKRIVNTPSITHYETKDYLEEPGYYYYRIIAFYQNGCESDHVEIEVLVFSTFGVDELATDKVMVYPNPTTGNITITTNNLKQINIVNSLGQTIRNIKADGDNMTLDLGTFDKGIYMLMIQTEDGTIAKRIIVE